MSSRVCIAVTGHRPQRLKGGFDVESRENIIIRELFKYYIREALVKYQTVVCISGMALGIDTLYAMACLDMKMEYPERVKLIGAVPFTGQEKTWPRTSQDRYRYLLTRLDAYIVTTDADFYNWQFMHTRNQWMVDNCDVLLAFYDESGEGGTAQCVEYARAVGKPMQIIKTGLKES